MEATQRKSRHRQVKSANEFAFVNLTNLGNKRHKIKRKLSQLRKARAQECGFSTAREGDMMVIKNPLLVIKKSIMRYKVKLPDPKKVAHILRLGKLNYTDVLAAKERSCCQTEKRSCSSEELLGCTGDTWKLRRGNPDKGKSSTPMNWHS